MAFFRQSPYLHPYEGHLYMYWVTTVQLLKSGVPWEAIQSLSTTEMNMLLGVQAALNQREQDEMAREQAKTIHSARLH